VLKNPVKREGEFLMMPVKARNQARRLNCQVCGSYYGTMRAYEDSDHRSPFIKIRQHIDHLIPRRWLEARGINPHLQKNLLSVCGSCHGRKKKFEDRLFQGDAIGWLTGLKQVGYPITRIQEFALSVDRTDFEGIRP